MRSNIIDKGLSFIRLNMSSVHLLSFVPGPARTGISFEINSTNLFLSSNTIISGYY